MIFSSGSVAAQKLFVAHTGVEGEKGRESVDLSELFQGHFDTVNAGPKGEPGSYDVIAQSLGVQTRTVLFLSDNVTGRFFSFRESLWIVCSPSS